ncbi:hypothetical protein [Streptomyces sp. BE133]|uniref:hypothetical protein n=1 Tax=Streptomyces sp. BE133 TaxID=3002523 RepID=UPI002E794DF3|nr:hypothetical protein [Streptomyces sp. BE133]MEE1808432.1 hypothetical protein [Streptomyces sp. BE133]
MPKKSRDELPDDVRAAIREQAATIDAVESVGHGFSSQFAAALDTARGRVFLPACRVVRLGFAGHDPHEAEQWAAKVPAWSTASTRELDVAATALQRYWRSTEDEHPDEWTHRLRAAADRWAAYRLGS